MAYKTAPLPTLYVFPKLKERRESAALTQRGLSELTRNADPGRRGVSKETISRLEREGTVTRRVGLIVFAALNAACGLTLDPEAELKVQPREKK